jgi:hypothetical protein
VEGNREVMERRLKLNTERWVLWFIYNDCRVKEGMKIRRK